ncbi:MAG: DUF1538 domain-containing protein [Desulfobacterota bacterium]|nr:DUF1538 domain-containing protein [Thermodesulfobacteriota bacterium]
MAAGEKSNDRIRVGFRNAFGLLIPYVRDRLTNQIKSVWLIIVYLVLFQTLVLRIAITEAAVIALGVALVVVGLTVFMEGLLLGLMPLGERVGLKLPQKSSLPIVLIFALILGFLATLAEPSIQILQTAGRSVKAWEAPLLYLMLTKHAQALVYAVGIGVGIAILLGMFRFYRSWSLKPLIYFLVAGLLGFTAWAFQDQNMIHITGLAWDCGAVTTGPVTVPLVIALGIGISRMVGSQESGSTGFGLVTLASLVPVIAVFLLGVFYLPLVPAPMREIDFFKMENREKIKPLFRTNEELIHYLLQNATPAGQIAFFDDKPEKMTEYLDRLSRNASMRKAVFAGDSDGFYRWAALKGTEEQRRIALSSPESPKHPDAGSFAPAAKGVNVPDLLKRNLSVALKAIGLLTLPLFLVLFLVLREKLQQADEVFLGLFFCILGLGLFSIGIELGLDKLGTQVGNRIPSSFKTIPLQDQERTILEFDPALVQRSISPDGQKHAFFYAKDGSGYVPVPYDEKSYNAANREYRFTPTRGPLFGQEWSVGGIGVVLFFAFVLGYGATLAEPALNAMGLTVEELTAGTFRKPLLMHAVAVGVGMGVVLGVAKLIWHIPLCWLLAPPYLLLLFITGVSSEEFVNIGWDSAGVTTGPVTVPLVLAMGLGLGSQVGVTEGFGILATASVCPILTTLALGLLIARKRKAVLTESVQATKEGSRL